MKLEKLELIFKDKPPFQLRQAKEAVFRHLISDWQEATNLPKELRETLNKECPLNINSQLFASDDKNTIKALITLEDGLKIETVLMRYEGGRNTVCVSSQVGCPLGCLFCATGKAGYKRNLTTDEISEQVLLFGRYLKNSQIPLPSSDEEGAGGGDDSMRTAQIHANCAHANKHHPTSRPTRYACRCGRAILPSTEERRNSQRVDNIVFMGMGEPFLNYENVMAAIKILNNQKEGMSIGARHISISTVGITEGVEKLADEPLQVNLAISLHAPNNKLRSKIVPMNKNYPIEKVFTSVDKYLAKTGRKVMFEYIMIKGLNDAAKQAKELAMLLKTIKNGPCMVNLISYNPTGIFDPSPQKTIKIFKDILMKAGVETTQRYKFGQGIKAACGQLARK